MAQIKKKEEIAPIELKDSHGDVIGVYSSEMVEAIKNTVAKDATDSELFMFLSVANKYDLDPFLGQIYYAKFKDDKGQIMSGRDGFRKIAMREPTYKAHYSDYVCKNDEFEIEKKMGKLVDITHKYSHTERGAIIGAYCVLETTDGLRFSYFAEMKYYNTGKNAWGKYPADMIIKVAETRVFKSFAKVDGVQAEEAMPVEYDRENNVSFDDEVIETSIVDEGLE